MADMARVRTVFTGVAGTPWYSNIYIGAIGSGIDFQAYTDAVGDFWESQASVLRGDVDYTVEGDLAILNDATGEITRVEGTTGVSGSFTSAAEPLPTQTQLLLRVLTNTYLNGRRIRGRIFIPGYCEPSSTAGRPAPTLLTDVPASFEATIGALPHPVVVWHKPNAETGAPGSQHAYDSIQVWSEWSVLRSRRD